MNEFLLLLLSMSLSGTLLALLLFLLRPLLKRNLSRAWMYYIWCIVALRMLLPFAPRQNLVGSLLADPSAAMRQLSALSAFTEDTAPAALPSDQVFNNAVSKAFPEKASGSVKDAAPKPDTLSAAVPAALDSAPPALAAEPVSAVLFTLWLSTAVFLFLHKAVASRAFLKKLYAASHAVTAQEITACYASVCRELSVRRPPRLLASPETDTAMLAGMLRPAVILPAAKEPDMRSLACILRHELIHYKRKDVWFKWIFQLTACIHFLNPVSHAVCREVSRCCELACDETVVKNMTPVERKAYGSTLLNALEARGPAHINPVSASLCGNAKFIKERLDTIKMSKKKTTLIKVLTPALTAGLCFGAFYLGAWAAPADPLQEESFLSGKNAVSPVSLTATSSLMPVSSQTPTATQQAQIPAGYTALRTESVSLEAVKELQLPLSYEDVTIYPSADNTLTYIFCGNNSWNYAENEIAALSLKDGTLVLESGVWNKAWSRLSYRKWQPKIFIYLPADLSADLSASIGSGSMKSTMAVTADTVALDTASGSMTFSDVNSRSGLVVSNGSGSTKTGSVTCTKAELDNSSGSLRMNAVNASMNGIISNGSGSLTAGNITVGTTAAAASDYQCIISNASGHMETGDVTVSGSLNLSTASGPASLGQVSAAAYTVSTASGSLKLTGLNGNGSLSCASGSIKAETLIPTGPVSMDNGSGSIRASIPENTGLEFYAAHIGPGSINAFFPIPDKKSASAQSPVQYGNAPYYQITASTQTGSITLNKK